MNADVIVGYVFELGSTSFQPPIVTTDVIIYKELTHFNIIYHSFMAITVVQEQGHQNIVFDQLADYLKSGTTLGSMYNQIVVSVFFISTIYMGVPPNLSRIRD